LNKILLSKVKKYVGEVFRQKGNVNIDYHNFIHTAEVVKVIEEISTALNLGIEDKEILLIAGWFHDIGYTECYDGHEDLGIKIAKDFLRQNEYPEVKIEKVVSLISATKLPRNPRNVLEEIICDADLHHLGTREFSKKEKLFRIELEKKNGFKMNDKVWLEENLAFLKQHEFYTAYAKEIFGYQKIINLNKVQKELNELAEN